MGTSTLNRPWMARLNSSSMGRLHSADGLERTGIGRFPSLELTKSCQLWTFNVWIPEIKMCIARAWERSSSIKTDIDLAKHGVTAGPVLLLLPLNFSLKRSELFHLVFWRQDVQLWRVEGAGWPQQTSNTAVILQLQYYRCTSVILQLQYYSCTAVILQLQYYSCTAVTLQLQYYSCTAVILQLHYSKGQFKVSGTHGDGPTFLQTGLIWVKEEGSFVLLLSIYLRMCKLGSSQLRTLVTSPIKRPKYGA